MPAKQMTFREWYQSLGDAMPLPVAAEALGCSQLELIDRIRAGQLKLHTFKAQDGRVFRMVRTSDLFAPVNEPAAEKPEPKPQISLASMAKALQAMIDNDS